MTIKALLACRRTLVAIYAITCLTILGYFKAADVAASIATVALAIAAANASQSIMEKKNDRPS